MSAMRVLHRELVELPKEADKDFKPRKANPNQWKVLHGPNGVDLGCHLHGRDTEEPDRLEEIYVSCTEDARLAAMALQNLIYNFNEGHLSV
jgi:hypothetical protein